VTVLGLLVAGWLSAAAAGAEESWDAIYVGSQKIGHTHLRVAPVKGRDGTEYINVQFNTVANFKRGKDRVSFEIRYGTIETKEGEVLRLDTLTKTAGQSLRFKGDVIDGKMNLVFEGGGQKQEKIIPWGPDVRGPYGAELSLSREPLKPGEKREVKTFIPDLNQICVTRLDAKDFEDIVLGGGTTRKLLRIEQTVADSAGKVIREMDTTLWVDANGQILKGHQALLGGTDMYRTTKAGALAANGEFDLINATIVKITRKIPDSTRTRDIVYRVTLKEGQPKDLFPSDQRQNLTPDGAADRARLEVRTESRTPRALQGGPGPDEACLRPNPLINSEDATVIEHMRKAVGTKADPWSKAVAIEKWVATNIRQKDFSTAFASATEVAQNLEGDCTEHSVLVAAMCRAAGIPTRCAIGLVYADHLNGFGPHMWNEVFVNGRWVAIDAAFDESEVDATHIKLSDASLDGVAPFEVMLPVLRVQNRLKIEPLEIR
jgi:transglutaminase-like putative cysteine protease